jgi:hypothetical protein
LAAVPNLQERPTKLTFWDDSPEGTSERPRNFLAILLIVEMQAVKLSKVLDLCKELHTFGKDMVNFGEVSTLQCLINAQTGQVRFPLETSQLGRSNFQNDCALDALKPRKPSFTRTLTGISADFRHFARFASRPAHCTNARVSCDFQRFFAR